MSTHLFALYMWYGDKFVWLMLFFTVNRKNLRWFQVRRNGKAGLSASSVWIYILQHSCDDFMHMILMMMMFFYYVYRTTMKESCYHTDQIIPFCSVYLDKCIKAYSLYRHKLKINTHTQFSTIGSINNYTSCGGGCM